MWGHKRSALGTYGLKSDQSLPCCARAAAFWKSCLEVGGILGVEAKRGRFAKSSFVRFDRGGKGCSRLAYSTRIFGVRGVYFEGGLDGTFGAGSPVR